MTISKPMKACDADLNKLQFPYVAQPKIDGVRGLTIPSYGLYARTMKRFANKALTDLLNKPEYEGFDGEIIVGNPTDSDLCRKTTSFVNTINAPIPDDLQFIVFDAIGKDYLNQKYLDRYMDMDLDYETYFKEDPITDLIESKWITNSGELEDYEHWCLEQGYEGVILRSPTGKYKQGRATVRENTFLRLKQFIEEDATVVAIVEGQVNNNEAKKNELGNTSRSSHKDNMAPSGKVGALICKCHVSGEQIKVSAGAMKHDDREYYFNNPDKLIGEIIQYRFFPKGKKDKLRFPTFHSIRNKAV